MKDVENLELWRNNPAVWLEERFGEDANALYWDRFGGYEDHEWDGTKNPLFVAWNTIASPDGGHEDQNWCGLQSGTGTGKTYILARIVFWFLDCYPNDSIVSVITGNEKERNKIWKEIEACYPKFKSIQPSAKMEEGRLSVKDGVGVSFLYDFCLNRPNDKHKRGVAGLYAINMLSIVCADSITDYNAIKAIVNGKFNKNHIVFAVGRPKTRYNNLNKFVEDNKRVVKVRASGYDHPNVVNDKEIIRGAITNSTINNAINKYGKSVVFVYKYNIGGRMIDTETVDVKQESIDGGQYTKNIITITHCIPNANNSSCSYSVVRNQKGIIISSEITSTGAYSKDIEHKAREIEKCIPITIEL